MFRRHLIQDQGRVASDRYNERFDNVAYTAATRNKSPQYANALIDDALAICGHPEYRMSYRNWCGGAMEFLALFV